MVDPRFQNPPSESEESLNDMATASCGHVARNPFFLDKKISCYMKFIMVVNLRSLCFIETTNIKTSQSKSVEATSMEKPCQNLVCSNGTVEVVTFHSYSQSINIIIIIIIIILVTITTIIICLYHITVLVLLCI